MDFCMICGRFFNKYLYEIHKPLKGVYTDAEIRDILGEPNFYFMNQIWICLPCVCLIHTLYQFKQKLREALMSYTKDGMMIKEFEEFKSNINMIPYSALTDMEIDLYKKNHQADAKSMTQERVETETVVHEEEEEIERNVEDVRVEDDITMVRVAEEQEEPEDEMLEIMYSERVSRASVCSPRVTRAKSAPCEKTTKLPFEIEVRKSNTPHFESSAKDKRIVYRCSLNVCYHHYESFDQLLHHVISEHGLHQNDLNFEEYKHKLEEYLEKTNLAMSVPPDTESKYPCLISNCYKKYTSMTDLNDHKVKAHNIWPRYSCSECYKVKFTSRDDLHFHNYLNHFQIDSYCIYCSEPLNDISELKYHLDTHITCKYPCQYCDKFFFSLNSARKHSKIHRYDKYKKRILRPKRRTILARNYMLEVALREERMLDSEEAEFSRVRLQIQPPEPQDDIEAFRFVMPVEECIVTRRDDEVESTISDYFEKSYEEGENESTISEFIAKRNLLETDCFSEGTDHFEVGSTISEFIEKQGLNTSPGEKSTSESRIKYVDTTSVESEDDHETHIMRDIERSQSPTAIESTKEIDSDSKNRKTETTTEKTQDVESEVKLGRNKEEEVTIKDTKEDEITKVDTPKENEDSPNSKSAAGTTTLRTYKSKPKKRGDVELKIDYMEKPSSSTELDQTEILSAVEQEVDKQSSIENLKQSTTLSEDIVGQDIAKQLISSEEITHESNSEEPELSTFFGFAVKEVDKSRRSSKTKQPRRLSDTKQSSSSSETEQSRSSTETKCSRPSETRNLFEVKQSGSLSETKQTIPRSLNESKQTTSKSLEETKQTTSKSLEETKQTTSKSLEETKQTTAKCLEETKQAASEETVDSKAEKKMKSKEIKQSAPSVELVVEKKEMKHFQSREMIQLKSGEIKPSKSGKWKNVSGERKESTPGEMKRSISDEIKQSIFGEMEQSISDEIKQSTFGEMEQSITGEMQQSTSDSLEKSKLKESEHSLPSFEEAVEKKEMKHLKSGEINPQIKPSKSGKLKKSVPAKKKESTSGEIKQSTSEEMESISEEIKQLTFGEMQKSTSDLMKKLKFKESEQSAPSVEESVEKKKMKHFKSGEMKQSKFGEIKPSTSGKLKKSVFGERKESKSGEIKPSTSGEMEQSISGEMKKSTFGEMEQSITEEMQQSTPGKMIQSTSGKMIQSTFGIEQSISGEMQQSTSKEMKQSTSGEKKLWTSEEMLQPISEVVVESKDEDEMTLQELKDSTVYEFNENEEEKQTEGKRSRKRSKGRPKQKRRKLYSDDDLSISPMGRSGQAPRQYRRKGKIFKSDVKNEEENKSNEVSTEFEAMSPGLMENVFPEIVAYEVEVTSDSTATTSKVDLTSIASEVEVMSSSKLDVMPKLSKVEVLPSRKAISKIGIMSSLPSTSKSSYKLDVMPILSKVEVMSSNKATSEIEILSSSKSLPKLDVMPNLPSSSKSLPKLDVMPNLPSSSKSSTEVNVMSNFPSGSKSLSEVEINVKQDLAETFKSSHKKLKAVRLREKIYSAGDSEISDEESDKEVSELETKYNLKKVMIILEDFSSVINKHLERKTLHGKPKVPKKTTEEASLEPKRIDAGSFERFAAERLGLELQSEFPGFNLGPQDISFQADIDIPCAETIEISTVEEVVINQESSENNGGDKKSTEGSIKESKETMDVDILRLNKETRDVNIPQPNIETSNAGNSKQNKETINVDDLNLNKEISDVDVSRLNIETIEVEDSKLSKEINDYKVSVPKKDTIDIDVPRLTKETISFDLSKPRKTSFESKESVESKVDENKEGFDSKDTHGKEKETTVEDNKRITETETKQSQTATTGKKKRYRKGEMALLRQLTDNQKRPHEIDLGYTLKPRIRKPPKKFEEDLFEVDSIPGVSNPSAEHDKPPIKRAKKKLDETVGKSEEFETKTKVKRLGMTDIIKKTQLPGKLKSRQGNIL